MAKDALTGCTYENAACPTPAVGDATLAGPLSGGYDEPDMPKETANMSGLPPYINVMDVQNAPARNATVEVADGVATPAIVAGNIDTL